jgi:hypothetical protein
MYKLKAGIDMDQLSWKWLSCNPAAIHMLETNIDNINWRQLSTNPSAADLLAINIDRSEIDWVILASNPGAISILAAKIAQSESDSIPWESLATNPKAASLLEARMEWCPVEQIARHPDRIDWHKLATNPNPKAIALLESNRYKHGQAIDLFEELNIWPCLADNPAAIHLLEANPDKIDWNWLSVNPAAMHLLEANLDKVNWAHLSANPAAVPLLKANMGKANWFELHSNPNAVDLLLDQPYRKYFRWKLSMNPGIFEYDYPQMKASKQSLHTALIEELFHPDRVQKHLEAGFDLEEYLP